MKDRAAKNTTEASRLLLETYGTPAFAARLVVVDGRRGLVTSHTPGFDASFMIMTMASLAEYIAQLCGGETQDGWKGAARYYRELAGAAVPSLTVREGDGVCRTCEVCGASGVAGDGSGACSTCGGAGRVFGEQKEKP